MHRIIIPTQDTPVPSTPTPSGHLGILPINDMYTSVSSIRRNSSSHTRPSPLVSYLTNSRSAFFLPIATSSACQPPHHLPANRHHQLQRVCPVNCRLMLPSTATSLNKKPTRLLAERMKNARKNEKCEEKLLAERKPTQHSCKSPCKKSPNAHFSSHFSCLLPQPAAAKFLPLVRCV